MIGAPSITCNVPKLLVCAVDFAWDMRRILIIGSSGAGKSTIARAMGERLGIPVHHLDERMWRDGCKLVDPHDEASRVAHLLDEPTWILDGNYTASLPQRLRLADSVVWVDYPRELCMFRALKRVIAHFGRNRPDMGGGCREQFDADHLKWIWLYPHRERPVLRRIIRDHGSHVRVIHLRFPHHARRWLEQLGPSRPPSS